MQVYGDKCIMNAMHSFLQYHINSFTALKIPCVPPLSLSLLPSGPLITTDLFIVSTLLPFPEYHVGKIMWYLALSDWLLSLRNMPLSYLHVSLWVYSFFYIKQIIFYCTYHSLSIDILKNSSIASKSGQV